jgi:putative endonuclease
MKWFVYLLLCADNTLYCGITNNILNRIKTHSEGKGSKYVRARLPVELVYKENYSTKSEALKREISIKKLSRIEKLKLFNFN